MSDLTNVNEAKILYLVRSTKVPTTDYVYGLFRDRGLAEFETNNLNRLNPWIGAVVHALIVRESVTARMAIE